MLSQSSAVSFLCLLAEAMVPVNLKIAPDRNRSKQKHDEKMIYRSRIIQGVIYAKV
jgi:hypothetical protein